MSHIRPFDRIAVARPALPPGPGAWQHDEVDYLLAQVNGQGPWFGEDFLWALLATKESPA
jgi:hypothetical protein